jgi:tRNA (cytidine/uridine-2'-O-)-methyltransferase
VFHIALFEPKIPQNTGNIIRLVANNGCHLHLIEPLGFDLSEKHLRRSGLDYADMAVVSVHSHFKAFLDAMEGRCIWALTTRGQRFYHQVQFNPEDVLLFGSETAGLSEEVHQSLAHEHKLRLPMRANNRSMNLSNSVAIVSYEAWRQNGFVGGV